MSAVMHTLDSFTNEMLQPEITKERLIHQMLCGLDTVRKPEFQVPAPAHTYESNLHGVDYDYEKKRVTIYYTVINNMYEPVSVSFETFRIILEGLALCIRQKKW